MAINKAMRRALQIISYNNDEVADEYERKRQLQAITGRRVIRRRSWNYTAHLDGRKIPVRLYEPPRRGKKPGLLLFFHGGGWVIGDIDSYDRVCGNMARLTGRRVLSVDYRLAPEHPFPAGLEDCYLVAQYLFSGAMPDVKPEDITLIGDSAGGNLAAAVCLMARDRKAFTPKRQILLYPATAPWHDERSAFPSVRTNGTDYLLTSKRVEEFLALYQSDPSDRENPYFAPLLAKDLTGQPDTLVITAEYDPLRDEGEAYGMALQAAGSRVKIIRLKDALHGFIALPSRFVHVKRAYVRINEFLEKGGGL